MHHECSVGVMVTASHNPKADNGFKVYWSNGSQIIPPHDANIASAIDANLQPWQTYDIDGVTSHPLLKNVTDEIADAYFTAIAKLADASKPIQPAVLPALKVTYTG
jgi:phosphomannomutase